MKTVAHILVKYKALFFACSLLAVISIFLITPNPAFDGDISKFDLKNNGHFEEFQRQNELFKTDAKVYVKITPKGDDRNLMMASLDSLEAQITARYPKSNVTTPLTVYHKMIRHWKNKNNSLSSFLKEARDVPVIQQLVAKDQKSFLALVSLPNKKDVNVDYFKELTSKKYPGIKSMECFSEVHIEQAVEENVKKDFIQLTLIIIGFFLLYILLTFRSWRAIAFAGVVVLVPIATALVLFDLTGTSLNLISILVLPIVLILSLSDALHLLSGYIHFGDESNQEVKLKKVVAHYFIPSFFSSATTAAAFFSFYLFNDSLYIQQFGLITSIALMIEFVIAFSIAPFLLNIFNPSKIYDKEVKGISSFLLKHKRKVSIAAIFILLLSTGFIGKLTVKSDAELFFPKNSSILRIHNDFKKNYYSSVFLNILVEGNKSSDPKSMRIYVKELVDKLKKEKLISSVLSMTDEYYFKSKLGVPVNLFGKLGGQNPFYDEKSNTYRIEVHFSKANDVVKFEDERLKALIADSPPEMKVSYASISLLMNEINQSVSRSLMQSLATSGIFIFLMILLLTRSISASFLSLLPNLVPIACIVLIYYFFGLNLNMITSLSLVICLGLLDDDTVHILYRKLWLKQEMNELSFSIISSAVILIVCFSFFLISNFAPLQMFGWVSALMFLIGVICELTMMQWVLEYVKKRK